MKNREEIVEILMSSLDSAYCDSCGTEDCDDCHRKYTNWELSEQYAQMLADKILEN